MESKSNGSNLDFGFAFNDINFSDRILRIEIDQNDKIEGECTRTSITDWFGILVGSRKERTKDKKDNELCNMECGIEVKTIHISSPILAAKSPYFLKLFSNGMKESEERHSTLRIHASEELALMDLLNFMYNNTLSSATTSSLLDVFMVADKFQVSSCIQHCIQLLLKLPMTYESAMRFLDLSSSVMMVDGVHSLTDAANKYIANLCKNFTRFEKEVLKLPLEGIENILSSKDLYVPSEDVVYEFVIKWARKHYSTMEERREILTTPLALHIRFKYMTSSKLKEILACSDFDPTYASKVVLDALFLKAEHPHLHTISRYVEPSHKGLPIKVLESKFPHPHCTVYLDLKKEECDRLLPTNRVNFEAFRLGGKWFYLFAMHYSVEGKPDSFELFLGMPEKESSSCSVTYEFSVTSKQAEEFVRQPKYTSTLSGGKSYGLSNIFGVSWSQFIAQDSIYFINGVLYLKAEITIKP